MKRSQGLKIILSIAVAITGIMVITRSIGAEDKKEPIPFGVTNPFPDWQDLMASDPKLGKTYQEIITDTLKDLGVGWVTDSVFRKRVEKLNYGYGYIFSSQPSYNDLITLDFGFYDNLIKAYEDADAKILFVINPKGDWEIIVNDNNKYKLTKNNENDVIQPPQTDLDFTYYKEYVAKVVDRYGAQVAGWFLFNEPADEYKTSQDIYDINSYLKLVEITYSIIKAKNPDAIVILGGPSASSKLDFYAQVLAELEKKKADINSSCYRTGCFDVWDYHTYAVASEYEKIWVGNNRPALESALPNTNLYQYKNETYRYFQIYRDLLDGYGFNGKPLITKEGGTYTGKDLEVEKPANSGRKLLLQDEKDQAAFLVKRAVYLLSKDVRLINWSTILEHTAFKGEEHNFFNYTGLIFNGIKNGGTTTEEEYFKPKLSFYTYKFLIEKLKDADFKTFSQVYSAPVPGDSRFNAFVYEFKNSENKTNYVAWLDYYYYDNTQNTPQRYELPLPAAVSINLPEFAGRNIQMVKAIPEKEGKFDSLTKIVNPNGLLEIEFNKEPVYIEEIPDTEAPSVSITEPLRNAEVKGVIKIKATALDDVGINRVEFYIDNALLEVDYDFPYEIDWNSKTVSDGYMYTIKAKAFNDAGNSAEDSMLITVNNGGEKLTLETSFKRKGCKLNIDLRAASSLQPNAKLSYILKDNAGIVVRKGRLDFKRIQNHYSCLIGNLPLARYAVEVESDKEAKTSPQIINPFENPDSLETKLFFKPKPINTEVSLEVKTTPYHADNCLHYSLMDTNTGKIVKQGNLSYRPGKGLYLQTFLLSKRNYKLIIETSYGGREEMPFSL